MAPAFLAGAFSPNLCEVKLYNEQFSGPLESEALLSWPDMLVLTGLNTAFDRMLHLTAYARTKNRKRHHRCRRTSDPRSLSLFKRIL